MQQNKQTDPTTPNGAAPPRDDPRLKQLQRRLLEAFDELWDDFVDPTDPLYDVDGSRWTALGGEGVPGSAAGVAFGTEAQLAEIRAQCRALALTNEFATNGHENRVTKPPTRFSVEVCRKQGVYSVFRTVSTTI